MPPYSSLIPLPKPYVVPGGRFREGYYWDTYFTMLGLQVSGREDLVDNMLDNFAHLIDTIGHIPNGNRTYYASRSQPPFFAYMVTLAAQAEGDKVYQKYLPALRKEHAYWMQGEATTPRGQATRHVVAMPDGAVLNRYWDASDTPRDESYLEDVTTAKSVPARPANEVYRDLRAGAESGWDYSSRWFGDGKTLATIRTTSIVPVDLNSLMFHLETTIVKGCAVTRDAACVTDFSARAAGGRDQPLSVEPQRLLRRLRLAAAQAARRGDGRCAVSVVRGRGMARAREGDRTRGAQDAAAAGRPRDDHGEHGAAVGCAERLGAVAVDRDRRAAALWRTGACEGHRHALPVRREACVCDRRQARREVRGRRRRHGRRRGGEYPLQDGFGWTNGVTLKLLGLYGE